MNGRRQRETRCAWFTLPARSGREARVSEPSRHAFGKLTTVGGLRGKLATLEAPFDAVRGRVSLSLDTAQLAPERVAEAVVRDFKLEQVE